VALDVCQTIFTHNNQPKIRGLNGRGTGEEIRQGRGVQGKNNTIVFGTIKLEGDKKQNKIDELTN
jgi:hypothetical protein